MLKFKLNKEAFEKLSEAEQTFYKKDGDVYQLDVEGAVDKDKLNEFRETNVELLKKSEQFKDVDLEKWKAYQEQERANADKELIDKKDFDGLIEQRTAAIKSDYEAKIKSLKDELDGVNNQFTSTVSKYEIDDASKTAFMQHKINSAFAGPLLSEIRNIFRIENGQVVGKDGDKILTGKNGNITIGEYVESLPEDYKIQSSAGNGRGGNGLAPVTQSGKGIDNIKAGLESLKK